MKQTTSPLWQRFAQASYSNTQAIMRWQYWPVALMIGAMLLLVCHPHFALADDILSPEKSEITDNFGQNSTAAWVLRLFGGFGAAAGMFMLGGKSKMAVIGSFIVGMVFMTIMFTLVGS